MSRRDTRLTALLLALALNSAYLAARADANLFYFANVALHVALGIASAALVVTAGAATPGRLGALNGAWRRRSSPRARRSASSSWSRARRARTASSSTCTSLLLGLAALVRPGRRRAPRARVLAAPGWPARSPWRRRCSPWRPRSPAGVADRYPPQHRIVNPPLPPLAMEGEGQGRRSPFFPSSAETNVGGLDPVQLLHEEPGPARAATRTSTTSGTRRRTTSRRSTTSGTASRSSTCRTSSARSRRKWCAGCHDHAVLFDGRFDRPIREQIDTPEAQAGLACTSCHSIVHVKSTMGQGDFTIEYPPLHDLAASENPLAAALGTTTC